MATAGHGPRAARDLGRGRNVSPAIDTAPRDSAFFAEITTLGTSQHVWMTVHSRLSRIVTSDGLCQSQQRFGIYCRHIAGPIRVRENLRVTIQALGWHPGGEFCPCKTRLPRRHLGTRPNLTRPSHRFPNAKFSMRSE